MSELPRFNLNDVSSVYVGKPNKCMCGCSGKYYYTKVNQIWSGKVRGYIVKDDEVSDAKVMRVISKVRANQHVGIENIDNKIFTLILGKTQYTIYLKHPVLPGFMSL